MNRRKAFKGAVQTAMGLGLAASSKPAAQASPGVGQVLGRRKTDASCFKQRAIADYQHNMSPFGGRLAAASQHLLTSVQRGCPWQFDVLIIGSGYGASITAARLAARLRPGHRLGVLERGREWVPGTFPDRLKDVMAESRLSLFGKNKTDVFKPTGLFNVQQFEEVTVLSGSGLGGSSLINANVALRADADVFQQAVWPQALQSREYLDPYYELAEYELGAAREPWDHTRKVIAQRRAAEYLAASGAVFETAKNVVQRTYGCELPVINRQGLLQRGCIDCGDCMTGCNVGAKNTLANNYIPMARRAGAEFYTQTEVHRIDKCHDHYRVHFTHFSDNGEGGFHKLHASTTTRVLVLGAGSIGSSEILMRSQQPGLQMSPRLGCNWTGNGDALGFIRKSQYPTGIGGYSAYPTDRLPVGTTIQTNINYPNRSLAGRVLIQEGTAARSYANALSILMRDVDLESTQVLLGMGHDGASGQIHLDEKGFGQVSWPGILDSQYRRLIRGEFQRIADGLGGEYKFLRVFGDRMISVHPLGGCGMSDDPSCGVVNHKGQVFDATGGGDVDPHTGAARVHAGLYVIDGSIFPTSIACNPFLTISAIAERSADQMLSEPSYHDLFEVID